MWSFGRVQVPRTCGTRRGIVPPSTRSTGCEKVSTIGAEGTSVVFGRRPDEHLRRMAGREPGDADRLGEALPAARGAGDERGARDVGAGRGDADRHDPPGGWVSVTRLTAPSPAWIETTLTGWLNRTVTGAPSAG